MMALRLTFLMTMIVITSGLISCGKHANQDAELASFDLSSNPFYEEDAQVAAATSSSTDGGTIGGGGNGGGDDGGTIPNPSATPSPSPSASPSPTVMPSPSPSVSPSPSASPSPTVMPSPSPSVSPSPSASPSPSPCPNSKTEAGFVRVCSQRRSGIKEFIFFEEAKNPILTVEYKYTEKVKKKSVTKRLILSYAQMKGMNLLVNPKPTLPIEVDLDALKELYPKNAWASKTLYAYICEDKKKTGTCGDKTGYDVLSIAPVSFRADRVPQKLSFELWSGRNKLLKTDPNYCEKQYSPLVLDLQGNGIKLSGPGEGVRFDLDDTGMPLHTGWVASSEDVFLVRDLNQNANIDSGAELFGSATRLANGLRALNGFEALIDLDSDGNGLFDAKDEAYREVQIWMDRNLNGETESNELLSLDRAGIISIDLNYIVKDDVDKYGNATKQRSTFLRRVNGKIRKHVVVDVWFNTLISH